MLLIATLLLILFFSVVFFHIGNQKNMVTKWAPSCKDLTMENDQVGTLSSMANRSHENHLSNHNAKEKEEETRVLGLVSHV